MVLLSILICECGEIGRRDGLRNHWFIPYRFDSDHSYQCFYVPSNCLVYQIRPEKNSISKLVLQEILASLPMHQGQTIGLIASNR